MGAEAWVGACAFVGGFHRWCKADDVLYGKALNGAGGELWAKLCDDDEAVAFADSVQLLHHTIGRFFPVLNLRLGLSPFETAVFGPQSPEPLVSVFIGGCASVAGGMVGEDCRASAGVVDSIEQAEPLNAGSDCKDGFTKSGLKRFPEIRNGVRQFNRAIVFPAGWVCEGA